MAVWGGPGTARHEEYIYVYIYSHIGFCCDPGPFTDRGKAQRLLFNELLGVYVL